MPARTVALLVWVCCGLVVGCGGGAREKGKNQDLDRPKAADTRR